MHKIHETVGTTEYLGKNIHLEEGDSDKAEQYSYLNYTKADASDTGPRNVFL